MHASLVFSDEEIELETERLRHFLDAVLEPGGIYEIRPVPFAKGGSIWARPDEIPEQVQRLMEWNRGNSNPYFSINRRKSPGGTKGADSLPGSLVVADFDTEIELTDVRDQIARAGLPTPTAIVSTSPKHWHTYWRLEACLPDLRAHKQIQRGLADLLGTCQHVCSHQQVMRLPGPFCNVKADRPDKPRVQVIDCDPNRIYPASLFPVAAEEPAYEAVPLDKLPIAIERQSLSDASRALINEGRLFEGKGRRLSIYEAARDMRAREWELSQAMDVLLGVAEKLGLEPDDQADIPRQVRNAFSTPATPGYAASEVATLEFSSPPGGGDEVMPELEAIPLPPPPQLPPLPEMALAHGVVGEFMDRVARETEAHPVALAGTLLVALGNIVGRGPHTVVGRTLHHPNLFLAVIGDTGSGRKGTAGDIVADCFRPVDAHWADRCQSPNLTSGEGVVDALRDRVEKLVPVKGGPPGGCETVVLDPGVDDKRLMITCSELVAAFKAGNRENSILSQVLREAWDGKTLRTLAKNAARTATEPHLSVVGHATRHELLRVVKEGDIFGGTYNRFLFVLSRRERLLPHGGDLDDLGTVPDRLAAMVNLARAAGRLQRSPAANRLWESVYEELTTPQGPEIVRAVLSRGEAQTLRLSMLMALAAGHTTIEEEDLLAALDLWRYSAASARAIFGNGERGLASRLLELIAAQPGISRSRLHKRVGWRVQPPELLAALAALRDSGAVICTPTKTGGRVAETWRVAAPAAGHGGVMGEKSKARNPYGPKRPNPTAPVTETAVATSRQAAPSCPPDRKPSGPSSAGNGVRPLNPGRYSI